MEPDAGQLPFSHKAWAWFKANKKQTLLGAGSILVVGVIIAFFLYRQNEADIAAGEALSNVSMPQVTAGGSRPDTAEAYLKVAAAYPKSRAGSRALLLAAGSLFVDGKYPEAKAQFERFKRDYSDSPFLGEALLGITVLDSDPEKLTMNLLAPVEVDFSTMQGRQLILEGPLALARQKLRGEPDAVPRAA